MFSFTIPISLLIAHFIGDFLLQSDWMALNKSKSNKALWTHCLAYTLPFLCLWLGFFQIVVLILTHFATDWVTSRQTSKLWFIDLKPIDDHYFTDGYNRTGFEQVVTLKSTRHWFFVCIGFDQLIHFITLALIYRLM